MIVYVELENEIGFEVWHRDRQGILDQSLGVIRCGHFEQNAFVRFESKYEIEQVTAALNGVVTREDVVKEMYAKLQKKVIRRIAWLGYGFVKNGKALTEAFMKERRQLGLQESLKKRRLAAQAVEQK